MEIQQCEINGKQGYKYGDNGLCYIGVDSWQKAKRDEAKSKALEFEKNPAPLPETKEEKEERQTLERQVFEQEKEIIMEEIKQQEKQKLKDLEKQSEDFEKEKKKPKNNP